MFEQVAHGQGKARTQGQPGRRGAGRRKFWILYGNLGPFMEIPDLKWKSGTYMEIQDLIWKFESDMGIPNLEWTFCKLPKFLPVHLWEFRCWIRNTEINHPDLPDSDRSS